MRPIFFAAAILCAFNSSTFAKPIKVIILAGQSNMEGDDPATAPLLKKIPYTDGKPAVCKDVWNSYMTNADGVNFTLQGKLSTGYGSM